MLRIGELSRRLGVSEHVLRAWERRYGLLRPERSPGGFRLYSEADLDRVRRMQGHLARGLSAAQAARAAIDDDSTEPTEPSEPPEPLAGQSGIDAAAITETLDRAVAEFDEPAAHAVLDRLLNTLTVEAVLRDVVLPYLYRIGEQWQHGIVGVAEEHFASNLIRGRLSGLARGWGQGNGPRAVLACAPGELHDIGLLAFGIVLHRNGWRVDYLGADTPFDDLIRMAGSRVPDLVVLTATTPERLETLTDRLRQLARTVPVAVAGAGATKAIADSVGARLLMDDPVTAARRLSSG
jgi:MerR family transcriptional regulator, light-induced transcriptional regulator